MQNAHLIIPRRRIAILQAATSIVAIIALIVSVTSISSRVSEIQNSRRHAAFDTCELFRSVIIAASIRNGHTRQGQAFLKLTGLDDCRGYVRRVVK